ncbi:hypothetical protein ACTFRP_24965 [Bacillus cereus group sp. MYBK234-1]|uniref:hypothetical protein n=1 Tax=unclassified Bacillus cereus group TaxID=2750818 RepID=UPI003F7B0BB5
MNGNSHYNYITIKELIFIHAYVTGEEIPATIRQARRYRIRKNGEELYGYYRKKHPKLFDKQKLYTYEELKHRAVNYCSSHLVIHL